MEVPSAVGGQPQCAAEPGPGGSCCAGLHAVLQSHCLLRIEGTKGLLLEFCCGLDPNLGAMLSLFASSLALLWQTQKFFVPPILLLPYLALLNNNPLKIKGC